MKSVENSINLLQQDIQSAVNSMKVTVENAFKRIEKLVRNPKLSDWWKV